MGVSSGRVWVQKSQAQEQRRERRRWGLARSLCPLLTLQFVPDVVGSFLDLGRELL